MDKNLNQYFTQFSWPTLWQKNGHSPFFNGKTYTEVFQQAMQLTGDFGGQKSPYILLKNSDPLDTIIKILSLWRSKKVPVLVANGVTPHEQQSLSEVCPYHEIIFSKGAGTPFSAFQKDAEALVVFTSGTTGVAKGVVHTFKSLFASALGSIQFYQIAQRDRWCLNLPLHHMAGFMIFMRCLLANAEITDQLENSHYISLVPTQLQRLLQSQKYHSALKRQKFILIGGAPLEQKTLEQAQQLQLNISQTYGMTESASHIWSTCAQSPDGCILPYRKLIIDEQGEILIAGETLFKGYFRHRQFHPAPLQNGYFKTADRGEFIANRLHIKGRRDNIFISGGENISPREVIAVALKFPQICDAYLIPMPHQSYGQIGVLFYASTTYIDPALLKTYFQENLSGFKIPKYFFPLDDLVESEQMKRSQRDLTALARQKLKLH